MPSIQEATGVDLSQKYIPVDASLRPPSAPSTDLQPGHSTFLRCPLPPIWQTSVDSLRQFYSGQVPQVRLFNPPIPTPSSGAVSSTTGGGVIISSSNGGSASTSSGIVTSQSSVVTPTLSPNGIFTGIIRLSKCFQLISVNSSVASRVELYGTAAAQLADSYRGVDVPPPAGSTMNIISDLALDTAPFQWTYQDRDGNNGDVPSSSNVYISVTNLSSASTAITITITFAPLVT